MAGNEGQPNPEKTGRNVRNVGLVIAALGLIAEVAALAVVGVGLAASGEIYKRANRPKSQVRV